MRPPKHYRLVEVSPSEPCGKCTHPAGSHGTTRATKKMPDLCAECRCQSWEVKK